MNKKGSAFLVVIFITTILSLITFGIWYKSSLVLDLIFSREKFYKNFYLTETLLGFGLNLIKNNFEQIIANEEGWPIKYDLNFLLNIINRKVKNDYKNFNSQMVLNKKLNDLKTINVFIGLYENKNLNPVFTISCDIKKEVLNDQKTNSVTSIFTIKNYNISNIF